jgi:hypothetical protein
VKALNRMSFARYTRCSSLSNSGVVDARDAIMYAMPAAYGAQAMNQPWLALIESYKQQQQQQRTLPSQTL